MASSVRLLRSRVMQDPNQPWAPAPPQADAAGQDSGEARIGPLIREMELIIMNLRPRTDYLVKVRRLCLSIGSWFMGGWVGV